MLCLDLVDLAGFEPATAGCGDPPLCPLSYRSGRNVVLTNSVPI